MIDRFAGAVARSKEALLALSLLMMLAGCASDGGSLDTVASAYGTRNPTPTAFPVCYAYGCRHKVTVSLTPDEWSKVAHIFEGAPQDARAERKRLVYGLQAMEIAVGAKTGLWRDKHGSFPGMLLDKQMDCVDEMVNTGTYLQLFEDARFLHHYTRGHRVSTSMLVSRNIWLHTVASVVDRDGGPEYIIDMWYGAHGELPYIMTRESWEKGHSLIRDF